MVKRHNNRGTKYTDEVLKTIQHCHSIRQALIELGLRGDGGGHKELRAKIKKYLTDNGNYKGQAHLKHRSYIKVKNSDLFCKSDLKRGTTSIRDALFKRGLKERGCEVCGGKEWLGCFIPLEIHHIDGDRRNNELNNLKILCPNCHYFTDTYKNKKRAE